mgnify:CR=1 FL=1
MQVNNTEPFIGEIRNGISIGKDNKTLFIYLKCIDCDTMRWAPRYNPGKRCKTCHIKYFKYGRFFV